MIFIMRVALDVNISNFQIGTLARNGDLVVCVAKASESDEVWLTRALDRDADIVISQDLDVPNLLDKWRVDGVLWFESLDSYLKWKKNKGH